MLRKFVSENFGIKPPLVYNRGDEENFLRFIIQITYGPLADTSIDPDVVFLRINAFQSMVIHDAYSDIAFEGKPQCHIIPIAKEQNRLAISTGCMLSRIRTGMPPEELTCTIPAHRLEEVIGKLEARKTANAAVGAYANQDLRRFESA